VLLSYPYLNPLQLTFDTKAQNTTLASQSPLWNRLWQCLGALSVYGGFVDSVRVGSRIDITSNHTRATVVSRNVLGGTVQVLHDDGAVSLERVDDVTVRSFASAFAFVRVFL
jgi:hypothetical protein